MIKDVGEESQRSIICVCACARVESGKREKFLAFNAGREKSKIFMSWM
jgi:hypothetical protein